MTARFLFVSVVVLFFWNAYGQQSVGSPRQGGSPPSLHAIGGPWPHIGSPPPAQASAARVTQWRAEIASFTKALDSIEEGWTGEAIENPEDLRFKVGRYEDAVSTVTRAGGYGNLVLADTLRRLSFGLLSRYLVTHPSEYAVVADILGSDRVNLLDCVAIGDMISEELKLVPPSGAWRFASSREEAELVYSADGTTRLEQGRRSFFGAGAPTSMVARRDVSGLLTRLIDDAYIDKGLRAFVAFLSRGGTIEDIESFSRLMADQRDKLRFAPTGDSIGASNIRGLILMVRMWDAKPIPFSQLVGRPRPDDPGGKVK